MFKLTLYALAALFLLTGCEQRVKEVGGNNANSPGARIDAHGEPLNPRGGPPKPLADAPDAGPDAAP